MCASFDGDHGSCNLSWTTLPAREWTSCFKQAWRQDPRRSAAAVDTVQCMVLGFAHSSGNIPPVSSPVDISLSLVLAPSAWTATRLSKFTELSSALVTHQCYYSPRTHTATGGGDRIALVSMEGVGAGCGSLKAKIKFACRLWNGCGVFRIA